LLLLLQPTRRDAAATAVSAMEAEMRRMGDLTVCRPVAGRGWSEDFCLYHHHWYVAGVVPAHDRVASFGGGERSP
jgi:hypothetical protein